MPSPEAGFGFSGFGPGLVISVFPIGTATDESPAVVALSDTPKFGGGSSVLGGSSLGGGGVGGGGVLSGMRWTTRGRSGAAA